MSRPNETTETVEIIAPVRITYRTPEGRAAAIRQATRLPLDWSCYGAEYVAAKSVGTGRVVEAKP